MTGELAAAGGFLALGVLLALAAIAGVITLLAARSRRADRRDSSLASLATLFEAPDHDPFAGPASANGELEETRPHPGPLAPAASSGASSSTVSPGLSSSAPFAVPETTSAREQEEPIEVRQTAWPELQRSHPVPDPAMRLETISDREWIDHAANDAVERGIAEGALRRALLAPPRLVAAVTGAVTYRLSRLRRPSGGAPQPADWDYESLERDFGLQERIGPLMVAGLVVLAAVIILGVWLVAAHHGAHTPVPVPHVPNPGPLGPQGSPGA